METLITTATLLAIAIFSGFIALEFYRSRDGRLRVLIIALFLAKIVVYGGGAVCLLVGGNINMTERLLINAPMCVVMWFLWKYIRDSNKK